MRFVRILIPVLVLLAGCEKVDNVSEVYEDIAGVYKLESIRFVEPAAVDLNGDGISSEDILSELSMLNFYDNNKDDLKAIVKGKDYGSGSDPAAINGSGDILLTLFLQYYDSYGNGYSLYGIKVYYSLDFTISSNGFLSVEPYSRDGLCYGAAFPMKDVMIFTINYRFYDFSTNSFCSKDSEWRFVRI